MATGKNIAEKSILWELKLRRQMVLMLHLHGMVVVEPGDNTVANTGRLERLARLAACGLALLEQELNRVQADYFPDGDSMVTDDYEPGEGEQLRYE